MYIAKLYDYNGKSYTIKELSKLCGVSESTLRERLKKGASIEDAMIKPLCQGKRNRKYELKINGKEMSLAEIANNLKIHPCTIYHRMQRGMSLEESITTPKQPQAYKYSYKGKPISRREIAKIIGVSLNTVKRRLRQGESVESLIENGRKDKIYLYKGKRYSFSELKRLPECSVSKSTFRSRIKAGWSVEKAVTTPAQKIPRKKYNHFSHKL